MSGPIRHAAVPATAAARDRSIDALRGFALFGIILVNAPFFAFPIHVGPGIATAADRIALGALWLFAFAKFFLIFSFLFGFGFWTAIRADVAARRASGPRFARRLAGLFAFGACHATFLFVGDILMLYAGLGILLWFARDLRPGMLLALSLASGAVAVLAQAAALTVPPLDQGETFARAVEAHLGGFRDAVRFRLDADLWIAQPFVLVFNGPAALSMFLLGLGAAKGGWFPGTPGRRGRPLLAATLLGLGLLAGLAGLAVRGVAPSGADGPTAAVFAAALAQSAAAPLVSAGYGLLVLFAADRRPDAAWVRCLATAGRMTLTGYLGHSVVLSWVFGGWGLGLYGQVSVLGCLMIGAATYGGLLLAFGAWQWWFRFGPDEWLLRSWIDGRWIRLKRTHHE